MSDRNPWWTDRDPGDENDHAPPEPEAILAESDWAICPNGHFAWLRPRDGALWCEGCGGVLYHESWSGERFPRVTL